MELSHSLGGQFGSEPETFNTRRSGKAAVSEGLTCSDKVKDAASGLQLRCTRPVSLTQRCFSPSTVCGETRAAVTHTVRAAVSGGCPRRGSLSGLDVGSRGIQPVEATGGGSLPSSLAVLESGASHDELDASGLRTGLVSLARLSSVQCDLQAVCRLLFSLF